MREVEGWSSAASGARRPCIAVIGAGPAGLMAAEIAAPRADVTIYERMPSAARKFLLAGRGGLNLTHSEDAAAFLGRYGDGSAALAPALEAFGPAVLRRWCVDLGIDTFVGSSGRVFPKGMKTSPLLRAWLRRLDRQGVKLATRHRWSGWRDDGALVFDTPEGRRHARADATVLALGGGSWPQLGSDGSWVDVVRAAGIVVAPLQPANCGFAVAWSDRFLDRHEGAPLKGIALEFDGQRHRGDLVVTREGLEGGPLYALAAALRAAIARDGFARLRVALRPDLSAEALADRLAMTPAKQSMSTLLRKRLKLAPAAIALLHEARGAAEPLDRQALACRINGVPLHLTAAAPLARAISTAGGVAWPELDPALMLRRRPGVFVAGEMLDWEAPTGGYLLQASFATGAAAGRGALAWLMPDATE